MSIDSILPLIQNHGYWILFPLAFFEGPITAFIAGTFVALGYFNFFIVYSILILGDLIPDVAYHFFGRYGEKKTLISRYASKVGVKEERFDAVRKLWNKHPAKTMFLTKFAYGLSTPLLVMSGLVGMPLRLFLRYSVLISIIQYAVLLVLGYYFGTSFKLVSNTLEIIQIGIGGLIMVMVVYYFLTRYLRKKFMKAEAEEELSS